jgi:hypothetical protein
VRRPTTLLSFPSLQRFRSRGAALRGPCRARHVPASAFLTLSPVSSPRNLPGLFHPGNALGIPTFRVFLLPGGPVLSRGPFPLLPFAGIGFDKEASAARLQRLDPSGSPYHPHGFLGPSEGRYPPGLSPPKALSSFAAGPASRPFLSCALPPAPEGPGHVASEYRRAKDSASPPSGRRPFWGFSPRRT